MKPSLFLLYTDENFIELKLVFTEYTNNTDIYKITFPSEEIFSC